jgi:hypothetical protein
VKEEYVKIEQDPNLSPGAAQEAASYQQRHERGRAARRVVPRGGQAEWEPAPDRPDPIDLLEAQARDRIQELIPIRYSRMMASPFAFMRGSAMGDLPQELIIFFRLRLGSNYCRARR